MPSDLLQEHASDPERLRALRQRRVDLLRLHFLVARTAKRRAQILAELDEALAEAKREGACD